MTSGRRFLHRLVLLTALAPLVAGADVRVAAGQTAGPAAEDHAGGPTWLAFPAALDAASRSGKMVLVDVWSIHCGWCARMQREVYTRPELREYLDAHFETGRLDIDVRTDTISYMGYDLSSAELSVAFGATGTPTTVFLTSDGTYVTRLPGFHDFDRFLEVLQFIGSKSYRDMSYEEYIEQRAGEDG